MKHTCNKLVIAILLIIVSNACLGQAKEIEVRFIGNAGVNFYEKLNFIENFKYFII